MLLTLLFAGTAAAHEEIPSVEIFTGYSLLNLGASNEDVRSVQEGFYPGSSNWNAKNSSFFLNRGAIGSFAFNMNEYFSLVVDARYNQGDIMDGTFEFVWPELPLVISTPFAFGMKNASALAGPRFSYRNLLNERATVFVHALAGLDYWRLNGKFTIAGHNLSATADSFGPGVSIGGGFDVNVSEKIAVRVIQADYYKTRQMERWMNNVNLSFGIVFRVGEKVLR